MLFYIIENYTNTTILANIDDWNIKSINVFTKLGFRPI
jgi:RimJ/RimL family protein N-acetyltransferase